MRWPAATAASIDVVAGVVVRPSSLDVDDVVVIDASHVVVAVVVVAAAFVLLLLFVCCYYYFCYRCFCSS